MLAVDQPEPICFVAPPGHPLAGRKDLTLEDLVRQDFLLTERGMSYRDELDQWLASRRLTLRPCLETGSAVLLEQLVERGMGLSFLPEFIVRDALAAGGWPGCTRRIVRWRCTASCFTTGTNG